MKRLLLGLLAALCVMGASAQAGLLSQQTAITDNLGPYYQYYFGSTGVVISNDGLTFVVGSPTVVFPPDYNDGTGAGELFQYVNGTWPNNGGLTSGPTTATGYGTGLGLSADGTEMFFGFGQSCPPPMNACAPVFANLLNTQLGVGFANTFTDPTGTPNLVSNFGAAAALSGNGQTLLIGAPGANAGAALGAGQVVFYSYNAVSKTWSVPTLIADPAATAGDAFGVAVALSADGQTALVGAYNAGVGIVPVYVFTLSGGVWTQVQKITGVNTLCQNCLALSADGQTVIISTDTGANIYTTASAWSSFLTTPITAPNGGGDGSVAISADGSSVLVGTIGTVYQYNLSGGMWSPVQHFDDPAPDPSDGFGQTGVALSADKESMVITAGYATVTVGANAFPQAGMVYVYQSPADLSLTLSASPSQVALNQTSALNATVTNNDAVVTAYNVSFTYTIPNGLGLVATNAAGGTCALSLNKTGQTVVTCVLPSLAPGATWLPQVLVKVTTAGAYTNTMSVTGNQPDPNPANNSASASISMLPPKVSDGSVSTHVDVPVSGTLNGSNPCLCGTPVFSIVTAPAHGTVNITNPATGAFTYTPAAGYIGSDSFTFQLANGLDTSGTATENITVTDVAPTANNGSVSTTMNQPVSAMLSATPGYAGQMLTYSVATSPAHGSVALTASSGAFTYTPAPGYTGSDSFTFTVGDGTLTSAIATESITVNAGGGGGGGGGALGFLALGLLGGLLAVVRGRRLMR